MSGRLKPGIMPCCYMGQGHEPRLKSPSVLSTYAHPTPASNPPSYTTQGPTALLIHTEMARCTRRPTSRLPQRCRYLQQLANVTSAAPQRFEFLLQFHRKNTRRLIQTAIDIHPRKSRSGASRSLQITRLRVAFFTRVDACH